MIALLAAIFAPRPQPTPLLSYPEGFTGHDLDDEWLEGETTETSVCDCKCEDALGEGNLTKLTTPSWTSCVVDGDSIYIAGGILVYGIAVGAAFSYLVTPSKLGWEYAGRKSVHALARA